MFAPTARHATANPAVRGHAARAPLRTPHANKPHQEGRGKRNPAAVNGDANPMMPSGGMTVSSKPGGERQTRCRRFEDHTRGQTAASAAAANSHSASAASTEAFGPKKFFAPGTI